MRYCHLRRNFRGRLLGDIQTAYSREDLSALRAMLTPEMLSYFSEQLAANVSRGLINRVTDVKLRQGDLAEAWREGRTDYATVAMKYELKDGMVERASGRTVDGGERSEVTEWWTFMRARRRQLDALSHPANVTLHTRAE
jgi:predicted lipid-binding transport protein (Tim44 family)